MDSNDIASRSKAQRESNDAICECITRNLEEKVERTKLILAALNAAAVPLDFLTASILHDLGCEMSAVMQAAMEDE